MKKIILLIILINTLFISNSQIVINELQASNTKIIEPTSGNFSDWIELYNTADTVVDISNFYITDDFSIPNKWRLPENTKIESKKHLIIWADKQGDGIHTNFGLSSNGEIVALFSSSLILQDSVTFPALEPNVSYARKTDGDNTWTFQTSSFDFQNTNQNIETYILSNTPISSIKSGFYNNNITITLSGANNIYYTTDGSTPTSNSNLYTSPITITSTTVLRAISIDIDKLESEILTQTYFINEQTTFPVISISTTPENLWGDETGIFAIGTNGETRYGTTANYWNDWEREINMEYFDENKTPILNQRAGFSVIGERRNSPQKSLRIYARGKYGDNTFSYPFFPEKQITEFSTLILRNGGYPDYQHTFFKDAFCQYLAVDEVDVDYQGFKPSIIFINGEYYGIYNIREKANEDYIESNFGVDSKEVNILDNSFDTIEGDGYDFYSLFNNVVNSSTIDSLLLKQIESTIDLDNFIDYHLTQIYYANSDWPGRNQRKWKGSSDESKWRWIFTDLDVSLGTWETVNHNTIEHATALTNNQWNNPIQMTTFIRKMLEVDKIQKKFLQRADALLNTIFTESHINNMLDTIQTHYQPEIARHAQRWSNCSKSNPYSSDGCSFTSEQEWLNNISKVRNFVQSRNSIVRQQFIDYFNLHDNYNLNLSKNIHEGGYLKINGIEQHGEDLTFFANSCNEIEAIPYPGYRFIGWENITDITSKTLFVTLTSDSSVTAYFEATDETILDQITKNTTLTKANSPYLINHDLIIPANTTLTIEAGVELRLAYNSNIFVYGNVNLNGSKKENITISPKYKSGFNKWGALIFVDATDSSSINYLNIIDASNGYDVIRDKGAISSWNSTIHINNSNITNVYNQPIFAQESTVYLKNSTLQSHVTGDLINIKKGYGYIDSCTFLGNNKVDTDAIDYDGITNGIIKNSTISGFYGFNSDGIDIGEQSKDILIENLIIHDCTDKGISIGQGSTAILKNNIIYACDMGIGIKDSNSYASIDKHTLYANNYGVATFQKNEGRGGGSAVIKNTIFSRINTDLLIDQYSNISTTYSLFENDTVTGNGNIKENPLFKNPIFGNFELESNSPAINSGDPTSPFDEDNTIIDMGATTTFTGIASYAGLYINEIMTSNALSIEDEQGQKEDWIEIYNSNDFVIDLAGLYFTDSLLNPTLWKVPFTNPQLTRVPAKGYLILWADGDTLDGENHLGLKLSKTGEEIGFAEVTNTDTIWHDSLTFSYIGTDTSYARYSDGSTNFLQDSNPTPGFTNNKTSPKIISNPNYLAYVNQLYSYAIIVENLENDILIIESNSLPSWLQLIEKNNQYYLEGTPSINDLGYYDITISATDIIPYASIQSFEISVLEPIIGIPEIEEDFVSIYPNPTKETLFIESNAKELNIEISNSVGQIQKTPPIKDNSIDVSNLINGIYFIKINDQNTYRLIKM